MSEVNGFYGSGNTPCIIFVYQCKNMNWYACEGASGVNATFDDVDLGVDVETLDDVEFFTADNPIDSVESLQYEVDDYLYG